LILLRQELQKKILSFFEKGINILVKALLAAQQIAENGIDYKAPGEEMTGQKLESRFLVGKATGSNSL